MSSRKNKGVGKGSMPECWKDKIRASQIANRMQKCFEGEVELTNTQLKAGEILFKRLEPELTRSELTGLNGGAIETKSLNMTDAEMLEQWNKQQKDGK